MLSDYHNLKPIILLLLLVLLHTGLCLSSEQTMFVQKLNADGNPELVLVDLNDTDNEGEALSDLLASSHYLDMFNDERRNAAYRKAIEKTVKPGMHVLDIGTGTGLLALLSARALRSSKESKESQNGTVTACEVFAPMANIAKKVFEQNGYSDLNVINKRSDELSIGPEGDMPRKADIIVSEIVDSQLIGEGILRTMQHAVKNLLNEGGKMIPCGAKTYLQVVESKHLRKRSEGDLDREQFIKEIHLDGLFPNLLKPLSLPIESLRYNFSTPSEIESENKIKISVKEEGKADAIIFWWDMQLDEEAKIILSTKPSWIADSRVQSRLPNQKWRDHWKTCWVPLPANLDLERGDSLEILIKQYELDTSLKILSASSKGKKEGLGKFQPEQRFPNERLLEGKWSEQLKNLLANKGTLWCAGLSLPDFARTHKPLSSVEGFDMSSCNKMLGAKQRAETHWHEAEGKEIWQCGQTQKFVTEPKSPSLFVSADDPQSLIISPFILRVLRNEGPCQALLFWVDLSCGKSKEESSQSKGSQSCRNPLEPSLVQCGLMLLASEIPEGGFIKLQAEINLKTGSLHASFT